MFKYIALFLFSLNAFAASGSGNISNIYNLGASSQSMTSGIVGPSSEASLVVPIGAISNYKTLTAQTTSFSGNYFYQIFDFSGGTNTQYQVPNGKKFYVVQVCAINSSIYFQSFQLGTATATFSDATGTVPTGAIFQAGITGRSVYSLPIPATNSATSGCWNYPFTFAQNTYPFLQNYQGDAQSVKIIGFEQ